MRQAPATFGDSSGVRRLPVDSERRQSGEALRGLGTLLVDVSGVIKFVENRSVINITVAEMPGLIALCSIAYYGIYALRE